MGSDFKEKWKEKVDLTYEQYFNPPWLVPHKGIVALARALTRALERELGKQKAHKVIVETAERLKLEGIEPLQGDIEEAFQEFTQGFRNSAMAARALTSG